MTRLRGEYECDSIVRVCVVCYLASLLIVCCAWNQTLLAKKVLLKNLDTEMLWNSC